MDSVSYQYSTRQFGFFLEALLQGNGVSEDGFKNESYWLLQFSLDTHSDQKHDTLMTS